MVKKKSCAILFTLLLTLLLGLLSSSYATTFSDNDLKNIFYNSLTNFGQHDSDVVKNALDSFDFSPWNLTADYSYTTIYCRIQENGLANNSSYTMYIYYNNDATKKSQVGYNYCKAYYNIKYLNGVITKDFGGVLNSSTYIQQNGHAYNYMVRYNDLDLYNGAGNTVIVTAGWHPSNIDEGIYNDLRFNFSYPNNSSFVTINNDIEPYEYCWISSGYQIPVGTLVDSWYTQEIKHNWATWNGSKYVYQHYTIDYNYDKHGVISNVYRNSIVSNNEWTTSFYFDTYNHANDILHIVITPKSRL